MKAFINRHRLAIFVVVGMLLLTGALTTMTLLNKQGKVSVADDSSTAKIAESVAKQIKSVESVSNSSSETKKAVAKIEMKPSGKAVAKKDEVKQSTVAVSANKNDKVQKNEVSEASVKQSNSSNSTNTSNTSSSGSNAVTQGYNEDEDVADNITHVSSSTSSSSSNASSSSNNSNNTSNNSSNSNAQSTQSEPAPSEPESASSETEAEESSETRELKTAIRRTWYYNGVEVGETDSRYEGTFYCTDRYDWGARFFDDHWEFFDTDDEILELQKTRSESGKYEDIVAQYANGIWEFPGLLDQYCTYEEEIIEYYE